MSEPTSKIAKLQAELNNTMDEVFEFQNNLFEIMDYLLDSMNQLHELTASIGQALGLQIKHKDEEYKKIKEKVNGIKQTRKELYI